MADEEAPYVRKFVPPERGERERRPGRWDPEAEPEETDSDEAKSLERKRWGDLSKEDVVGRIERLQQKNRERRAQKVTAEQMQQRIAERAAAAREKAASRTKGLELSTVIRLVISGLLLLGALILAWMASSANDLNDQEQAQHAQDIAPLQRDIALLQQGAEDPEILEENFEADLAQARERAEAFAANGFVHRGQLGLARFAPEEYPWEVISALPETGSSRGTVSLVWASTDDEGRLLAWASSSYYPETESFGSVQIRLTSIGQARADFEIGFTEVGQEDDQ